MLEESTVHVQRNSPQEETRNPKAYNCIGVKIASGIFKDIRLFMKEAKTQNHKIAPLIFIDLRLFMKGAKTQDPKIAPGIFTDLRFFMKGAKT